MAYIFHPRTIVAVGMILVGFSGLVGGVHQLMFPPNAYLVPPPWGGSIDLLFGVSLTVSSTLWLIKGSGWGRYVAVSWMVVIIPACSVVLGILSN